MWFGRNNSFQHRFINWISEYINYLNQNQDTVILAFLIKIAIIDYYLENRKETMDSHKEANGDHPSLSAIVVIGLCRERSQRCVDALYSQTASERMEIIIVDMGADQHSDIRTKQTTKTTVVKVPLQEPWVKARKAGIDHARGDIIAFVEDHTIPAPDWAEVLIRTHQGPWAAVGYAFTNANPETYMSRASLVSDYALWMDPLSSGTAMYLPGNNVSYKREILLELGDQLGDDLGVDFNIHEALRQKGYSLYLEGRALVAHENYDTLMALLEANHHYCRLLAADRVTSCSYSLLKRLGYGLAIPLGAPAVKLMRLFRSMKGRRVLWKSIITTSPVLLVTYLWSAVGESLGYLLGAGKSNQGFIKWELNQKRVTR